MIRLLFVDGDPLFARSVQRVLEQRSFAVETVCEASLAFARMQLAMADVCVLGIDLQHFSELELLRKARANAVTMPVLALVRTAGPADRVHWLNSGADDIMSRPFDIDELAARLAGLHRRNVELAARAIIRCGPLSLDVLSGSFFVDGALLYLSPKEHAFLRALIARPGYLVPKDRLCRAVQSTTLSAGALDVLACRLRRRLEGTGVAIATLRGTGYLLRPDGAAGSPAHIQNETRSANSEPIAARSVATAPEAT